MQEDSVSCGKRLADRTEIRTTVIKHHHSLFSANLYWQSYEAAPELVLKIYGIDGI